MRATRRAWKARKRAPHSIEPGSCLACEGTGYVSRGQVCPYCEGTGRDPINEPIVVWACPEPAEGVAYHVVRADWTIDGDVAVRTIREVRILSA